MSLVVQKYGGTSVANIDKIASVARKVIRTREAGNDVVVVLSAMAGETDRLINMAQKAADEPDAREYDSLISTGEQVTVTLLAIMLNGMGCPAKSFLGFQVRVLTDQAFKKARPPFGMNSRRGPLWSLPVFRVWIGKITSPPWAEGDRTPVPWLWQPR